MPRVVVEHTRGDYPGLRQICGVFPPLPPGTTPPLRTDKFWMDGRHIEAVLIRATKHMWLYREVNDANASVSGAPPGVPAVDL